MRSSQPIRSPPDLDDRLICCNFRPFTIRCISPPPSQRPLGEVERSLLRLYVNCRLSIEHPRQLYQEYAFTYDQLALIAGCSVAAMTRWMNSNKAPRHLKLVYQRRLGEFAFLLHHYHQIPPEVWEIVCPLSPRLRAILYPPRTDG